MRWAAASACLLLIAVVGSRTAAGVRRGEEERAAMPMASASAASARGDDGDDARSMVRNGASGGGAVGMPAQAVAKARLARKAGADVARAGGGGGGGAAVHAVRDADVADPNSRLARLLEKKAAMYERAGSSQLAAANRKLAAAQGDRAAAERDEADAKRLRGQAAADRAQGARAKETFVQAEQAPLRAQREMRAADKAYRDDALALAGLYPQVEADKEAGVEVPTALAEQLRNVTGRLRRDAAVKEEDGSRLASMSASRKGPGNVRVESQVFDLSLHAKDARREALRARQLADSRIAKGREEEAVAKRVLAVASCIRKQALTYSYDDNRVARVEATYQRVLDDCNA